MHRKQTIYRLTRSYSSKKEVENAFTKRLEQLKDDVVSKQDPLLGDEFKKIIDKDDDTIARRNYEYNNQRTLQQASYPSYVSGQSKDIAQSQPWTGEESQKDSSLRMLVDKYKPLRIKSDIKKLANAKEVVLDYRLNKDSEQQLDEDSTFRKIYHEKFTPIGSFEKIRSIADVRIEEHMKQGGFRNLPRGEKLSSSEVRPYVDRTEHHLNNMLVKQNIVPPWIEKQSGVNADVTKFREELLDKWETHVTLENEVDDLGRLESLFESKYGAHFDHRIRMVNNSLRSYNLQAPLSTQKLYLLKDKELKKAIGQVDIHEARERYREAHRQKVMESESKRANPTFFFNFWSS